MSGEHLTKSSLRNFNTKKNSIYQATFGFCVNYNDMRNFKTYLQHVDVDVNWFRGFGALQP
jgi:hypothetical protein